MDFKLFLGKEKVSFFERCPHFMGVPREGPVKVTHYYSLGIVVTTLLQLVVCSLVTVECFLGCAGSSLSSACAESSVFVRGHAELRYER